MIASRRVLRLAAVVITNTRAVIHNGGVVFKILWNPVKRSFNVSSLKDEQIEAAVYLLRSKEVVAILPTGFEESLIYQAYATAKEMQMCEC